MADEQKDRPVLDPFDGNRALTTADLPALAEYVKQANAPKRSTSSAKAKKDGGKKS
jgi:hypothetical protein